jgi:hypothetical protein
MRNLLAMLVTLASLCHFSFSALQTSVTQYGITWTFDTTYEVGNFATGDWWVVGPVTITDIRNDSTTPAYSTNTGGRTMNGSMINPSPNTSSRKQGYDSHGLGAQGTYAESLNVGLDIYTGSGNTLVVPVNASLVTSISYETPGLWPQLRAAAVLTVLSAAPPAGSFRPSYCGTDKTIKFNQADLDYSILKAVARTAGTPTLASITALAARPWLDHMIGYLSGRFQPAENQASYGREFCTEGGLCALALNLNWGANNDSLKEKLYIGFVQAGLDLYGCYQNGMSWAPDGGIWSGRKLPILLAGLALQAAHPADSITADMASIGSHAADDPYFQEDAQTFYISSADIYTPPYTLGVYHWTSTYNAGTVTINPAAPTVVLGSGTVWADNGSADYDRVIAGRYFAVHGDSEAYRLDAKAYKIDSVDYVNQRLILAEPYRGPGGSGLSYETGDFLYYGHADIAKEHDLTEYTSAHLGWPEWGIRHATNPTLDGLDWNRSYLELNGWSWTRMVLAVHIMGLKDEWNHNALFDWMDRFTAMRIYIDSLRLNNLSGTPFPGPPPGIDINIPGFPPEPDPVYGWNTSWFRFDGFDREMWDTYRVAYPPVWPNSTGLKKAIADGTPDKTDFRTYPRPMQDHFTFNAGPYRIDRLVIYDPCGQIVCKLDGDSRNIVTWDGCDGTGQSVRPGIYPYRVTINGRILDGIILKIK